MKNEEQERKTDGDSQAHWKQEHFQSGRVEQAFGEAGFRTDTGHTFTGLEIPEGSQDAR